MPSGDAAIQEALDGEAVEPFEDARAHAKSFQPPEGEKERQFPLNDCAVVCEPCNSLVMWAPRTLKLSTRFTTAFVNVNGDVLSLLFPVVHYQHLGLTDVEEEAVVLAQHCQITDLSVGCLISSGDQAYHQQT